MPDQQQPQQHPQEEPKTQAVPAPATETTPASYIPAQAFMKQFGAYGAISPLSSDVKGLTAYNQALAESCAKHPEIAAAEKAKPTQVFIVESPILYIARDPADHSRLYVSSANIKKRKPDELLGVFAHEVSHVADDPSWSEAKKECQADDNAVLIAGARATIKALERMENELIEQVQKEYTKDLYFDQKSALNRLCAGVDPIMDRAPGYCQIPDMIRKGQYTVKDPQGNVDPHGTYFSRIDRIKKHKSCPDH